MAVVVGLHIHHHSLERVQAWPEVHATPLQGASLHSLPGAPHALAPPHWAQGLTGVTAGAVKAGGRAATGRGSMSC